MNPLRMCLSHEFLLFGILFSALSSAIIGKSNQRIHQSTKAIHYVDPTKQGFRVILRDQFLRQHMTPNLLPTLYLTAISLRHTSEDGEEKQPLTRMFYPDSVTDEERQIAIDGLREKTWYYVCIEWENFNRHNETTGTDCRIFRTLDQLGRGADSTVASLEASDFSSQMLQFRIRAASEFPLRLTASLEGGKAPAPPSLVFQLPGSSAPVELELIFPFLRQQMDYGQLCILEEPQMQAYTALGRLVTGIAMRNCHFSNLSTTDYELSILESAEASPYMRSGANPEKSGNEWILCIVLMLVTNIWRDPTGNRNRRMERDKTE